MKITLPLLFGVGCSGSGAGPEVSPIEAQRIDAGGDATYTITDLDDEQAYRITLVVEANITPTDDGGGLFFDGDGDGAADAGPSETVALITNVEGAEVTGAKTVPAPTDDPAAPTGVFPTEGRITVTVTGVGAGTVYPVAYPNGGASTFLELDEGGEPVEPHGVGGGLTVTAGGGIAVAPTTDQTIPVDGIAGYTVSGLDDARAYRITLVLDDNLTLIGSGAATFLDEDLNGAADSGLSELVANVVSVNGVPVTGTKTVPSADDDPAAPSGVFPVGGQIWLEVVGLAAGKVRPVAYPNGGSSTFLEIDGSGAPIEAFYVGGAVTVQ